MNLVPVQMVISFFGNLRWTIQTTGSQGAEVLSRRSIHCTNKKIISDSEAKLSGRRPALVCCAVKSVGIIAAPRTATRSPVQKAREMPLSLLLRRAEYLHDILRG